MYITVSAGMRPIPIYIYIYVYVCVCVCVHVYIHDICTYIHTMIFMYIHTYIHTYIHYMDAKKQCEATSGCVLRAEGIASYRRPCIYSAIIIFFKAISIFGTVAITQLLAYQTDTENRRIYVHTYIR